MHILIIGGTGMLSGVAIQLAREGHEVSVIGRTQSKFDVLLQQKVDTRLFPLIGDYHTEKIFVPLEQAMTARGFFDVIISWCPVYGVLERISRMNMGAESFSIIHIKGSRRYFGDVTVKLEGNCSYHEVFLGFQIETKGSRWLTHEEICQGVLSVMQSGKRVGVIGQIEPYEKRPYS